MIKDGKILLGRAGETDVYLEPSRLTQHGLIAGASGTGKTVTLKVIAESLSELGVPTVIADVKGDLTGMIEPGDASGIAGRTAKMGITDYPVTSYPVQFFDVNRKEGHPIRTILEEMDPKLLGTMLDLTDAQMGVLQIVYQIAADQDLDLIDYADLEALCAYVHSHAREISASYGNVTAQSIGALQRKLLTFKNEQGNLLFGMPALELNDLYAVKDGRGVMNILECRELYSHPMQYVCVLLWLLNEIYENSPEVGAVEKPKLVFFFDEAHLLFDGANAQLKEMITRIVRLIRSKGIGIFFITQSPADIPDDILGQLGSRIQHSLHAYTPAEIKAVKTAAQSFRPNPAFKTEDRIGSMPTGTALISALDSEGVPGMVQETMILPPHSSMKAASASALQTVLQTDGLYDKYQEDEDPESALEKLDDVIKEEEKAAAEEKEKAAEEKEKARAEAARKREKDRTYDRLARKLQRRAENEIINAGVRSAKKILKGLF
jgi:DNA helicase HerA-like ATPase